MRPGTIIKSSAILISALSITLFLFLVTDYNGESTASGEKVYSDLYVCSMHPQEASEGPGSCSICKMKLSKVEGHKHETGLPEVDKLYVSPTDPMYVHEGPGKDPTNGKDLIPMTQSPIYTPPSRMESHPEHEGERMSDMQTAGKTLWTCGMHPEVIQDEPGICPICQMALTPLKGSTSAGGGSMIEIDPVTLQNIGVVTEKAARRDLFMELRTNGIIESSEDRIYKVNARVSGWVEKLYVARTGDLVKEGQKLLEIYSPELVAAQEEYLLAVKNAQLLHNSGMERLQKDSNALIEAARRRLELWNISPEQIDKLEKNMKISQNMTLVSPATGIVLQKNIVEGARVMSGMDLYVIADLREVWVKGQIYEFEAPWIKEGDRVKISSSYDPGLSGAGSIEYVYPTVDARNRTIEVRIVLSNPDLKWKPEMYVDALIYTSRQENVTSVSKSAVLRSGTRDLVFISKGEGKFEPRQVHIGLETDQYYEIPHGLDAGEEVVLSAQFLLDSEAKLQEALQRRLQQRENLSSGGGTVEALDTGEGTGHVH